jgi:hypothetical protein
MSYRTIATAVALGTIAALGIPQSIGAQVETVVVTERAATKADKLETRARALRENPRSWREAARLFEKSAAMRAVEDPGASRGYALAAHVHFALRDLDAARQAMLRSADRAHARGDVVAAATGYVDAAWLAGQMGDRMGMAELTGRARALAASPLITASQRGAILERTGAGAAIASTLSAPSAP